MNIEIGVVTTHGDMSAPAEMTVKLVSIDSFGQME